MTRPVRPWTMSIAAWVGQWTSDSTPILPSYTLEMDLFQWSVITTASIRVPRRLVVFTEFREGVYRPDQLGLPFPEVRRVRVGTCPYVIWKPTTMAHAHPDLREICVRNGGWVLDAPDKASEIMWHEYAHVLTNVDHDSPWRSRMATFGFPHASAHFDGEYVDVVDAA